MLIRKHTCIFGDVYLPVYRRRSAILVVSISNTQRVGRYILLLGVFPRALEYARQFRSLSSDRESPDTRYLAAASSDAGAKSRSRLCSGGSMRARSALPLLSRSRCPCLGKLSGDELCWSFPQQDGKVKCESFIRYLVLPRARAPLEKGIRTWLCSGLSA